MRIGDLRHRIKLQKETKTPDGRGGWVNTWADVATMWAAVEALRPFERIQAQQTQTGSTYRATVRRRTDIQASMRFVWEGKYLYIQGPAVDPDGRRRWTETLCEQREG